jgi:hypothetical protein
MDSDPTVVPARSVKQWSWDSSVEEVWNRLAASGEPAAVIVCDGAPAAVVTRAAAESAMTAGMADASVGAVADFVAVPVDHRADALDTMRAFTRAGWAWLIHRRQ